MLHSGVYLLCSYCSILRYSDLKSSAESLILTDQRIGKNDRNGRSAFRSWHSGQFPGVAMCLAEAHSTLLHDT